MISIISIVRNCRKGLWITLERQLTNLGEHDVMCLNLMLLWQLPLKSLKYVAMSVCVWVWHWALCTENETKMSSEETLRSGQMEWQSRHQRMKLRCSQGQVKMVFMFIALATIEEIEQQGREEATHKPTTFYNSSFPLVPFAFTCMHDLTQVLPR